MKILQKIFECKSMENYQENVYDKVYFSYGASLECTDCNSTFNSFALVPPDYFHPEKESSAGWHRHWHRNWHWHLNIHILFHTI